jgi:Fur family ferric uptake transcriptional regulator
MTPSVPDRHEQDDWQAQLRGRGYRLTVQRQLVLEAVAALGHATPDDIAANVQRTASSLNISTVYRTLELLEELGIVRHAHLGHGAPTYSLASARPPVHLVCSRCGDVGNADIAVAGTTVRAVEVAHGFQVDIGHMTLTGLCRTCAAQ